MLLPLGEEESNSCSFPSQGKGDRRRKAAVEEVNEGDRRRKAAVEDELALLPLLLLPL